MQPTTNVLFIVCFLHKPRKPPDIDIHLHIEGVYLQAEQAEVLINTTKGPWQ